MPETVYIFETKLDAWAASLGFAGVFAPGGIFSAKVVGSVELVASILLVVGALGSRLLQAVGALLSAGVISGAIFFHLFTPLGIAVLNADGSSDGGALFMTACMVWVASMSLLWMRKDILLSVLRG